MKRRYNFLFSALLLVWGFTGVASSASKTPMTMAELALYNGTDRQQMLEDGAKKEGTLTFYTSGILKQAVSPVVDAFQKKYPYIKVEIWRAETPAPRIIEEYGVGKYLYDVAESSQLPQMLLQKGGVIQPFFSLNLTYIQEGAITRASSEGALAAGFRESGIVLGYNTKLLAREQAPKTYQDLLDPKWKGKGAIDGGRTGQNWMGGILAAHGEEFVKQLANQNFATHMVSARAVLDMVINGEYMFSTTSFDSHVIKSKKEGAPCDQIPLEPVYVNIGQIALAKRPPHPHAALLFIDFELSKESGDIHKTSGYNPTRKDLPGTTTYKKFYGMKSLEDAVKWEDLFNRIFLKK